MLGEQPFDCGLLTVRDLARFDAVGLKCPIPAIFAETARPNLARHGSERSPEKSNITLGSAKRIYMDRAEDVKRAINMASGHALNLTHWRPREGHA